MKYVFAIDLDGTLLNKEKKISKYSIDILRKAHLAGHDIVISTGRPWMLTKDYVDQLDINCPSISFNGGIVKVNKDGKYVDLNDFEEKPYIKNHIKTTLENQIETLDLLAIYESEREIHISDYSKINDRMMYRINHYSKTQIMENNNFNPLSILVSGEEQKLKSLAHYIENNLNGEIIYRQWRNTWEVIEITSYTLCKSNALNKILKNHNGEIKKLISFGDENNDLEMLRKSHLGVAVGNASEEVKNEADIIIGTNEEDGVAKFISKFLTL